MMYFKPQKSIVSKTMGWEIWVVKSMESNGIIKANTFKNKKDAFSFYKRGKYAENKEIARQKAIDWQNETAKKDIFYSELVEKAEYFQKIAKRYGLIKEFKENGII